jgi:hypothetical protein
VTPKEGSREYCFIAPGKLSFVLLTMDAAGGLKLGLRLGSGRDSFSHRESGNYLPWIESAGYRRFNKSRPDRAICIVTFLQHTVVQCFMISLQEQIRYVPALILRREWKF